MFRAFAIALVMVLAASMTMFVVVERAVREHRALLPALAQQMPHEVEVRVRQRPDDRQQVYVVQMGDTLSGISKSLYGRGDAWPRLAQANNLPAPYLIRAGQPLVVPDTPELAMQDLPAAPQPAATDPTWFFWLRVLGAFLMILVVAGAVVLEQAARVLEIPGRGFARSSFAMLMTSFVLCSAGILAWGLMVTLQPVAGAVLSALLFVALLVLIALPGMLGVLQYSFRTTPGKAVFLMVSYRAALTFSALAVAGVTWLVLSGWFQQGVEAASDMVLRQYPTPAQVSAPAGR